MVPKYFKGVGPGTYWAKALPHLYGFTAQNTNCTISSTNRIDLIIDHIAQGAPPHSPFISLTSSLKIAECYAMVGSSRIATPSNPGLVFEIRFDDPLPLGLQVFDPIQELADIAPDPPEIPQYHHDGDINFFLD